MRGKVHRSRSTRPALRQADFAACSPGDGYRPLGGRQMNRSSGLSNDCDTSREVLREDGEYIVFRTSRRCAGRGLHDVLLVVPVGEHPSPDSVNRLTHQYELRDDLDDAWAARPLELLRE